MQPVPRRGAAAALQLPLRLCWTMAASWKSKVGWGCGALGWAAMLGLRPAWEVAQRESPEQASSHAAAADARCGGGHRRRRLLSRTAIERLQRDHYVVLDGLLTRAEVSTARVDCCSISRSGRFSPTEQHSDEVRGDTRCWVTEGQPGTGDGILLALRRLRGLAHELVLSDLGPHATSASGWQGFDDGVRKAFPSNLSLWTRRRRLASIYQLCQSRL